MFYTIQSSLAYSIGNVANGLANNGMTDAERAALSHDDPEYRFRSVPSWGAVDDERKGRANIYTGLLDPRSRSQGGRLIRH